MIFRKAPRRLKVQGVGAGKRTNVVRKAGGPSGLVAKVPCLLQRPHTRVVHLVQWCVGA